MRVSKLYESLNGDKTTIVVITTSLRVNPFKPEFTVVIFIHYKPRIAVAIRENDLKWTKNEKNDVIIRTVP